MVDLIQGIKKCWSAVQLAIKKCWSAVQLAVKKCWSAVQLFDVYTSSKRCRSTVQLFDPNIRYYSEYTCSVINIMQSYRICPFIKASSNTCRVHPFLKTRFVLQYADRRNSSYG